jgi:hypothetical protein
MCIILSELQRCYERENENMNGDIVEEYFDVVKETTELEVQENLQKLFSMNET